jgi:hypothetical protein
LPGVVKSLARHDGEPGFARDRTVELRAWRN